MRRRPPRSTLFPYTPLFLSCHPLYLPAKTVGRKASDALLAGRYPLLRPCERTLGVAGDHKQSLEIALGHSRAIVDYVNASGVLCRSRLDEYPDARGA